MILQLLQAKVSPKAAIVQGGAKVGAVNTPVLASATSGTAMGVESSSHTNPTPFRAVGEEHSAKLPEPTDVLSASSKRFGASFSKLPRRELHEATRGLVQTAKVKGMDLSHDEAMDNDPEMAIYGAFAAEAKFAINSDDDDDESVATSSPFSRSMRESAMTAECYTEEELEDRFYATFVLDKRFPPLVGTLPTYGIGGSNEKDMPALLMAVQRIMCASSLNPNEHGARLLLATLGAGFANLFERRMIRHLRNGKPTTWKAMRAFMLENFPASFTKEDAWKALQSLKWDGKSNVVQFNNDFEEMRVHTGIGPCDERVRHTYLNNIPWVYRNPIISQATAAGWRRDHSVAKYYDYMAANVMLLRLLTKYDSTSPAAQQTCDSSEPKVESDEQQRALRMNNMLPRQPYAQRPSGPSYSQSGGQQQHAETNYSWRNSDRKNSATIRQVGVAEDNDMDDAADNVNAFTIDVTGVYVDNHYDDFDPEIDMDSDIEVCQ
ncbi:hypothetical protein GGF42_005395, partial [Coemansia sp. RSA 2424]